MPHDDHVSNAHKDESPAVAKFVYDENQSDSDLASTLNTLAMKCYSTWFAQTAVVATNINMFNGDQWTQQQRDKLIDKNMETAIWNVTQPITNKLYGKLEQAKQDLYFSFATTTSSEVINGVSDDEVLKMINGIHKTYYRLSGLDSVFSNAKLSSLVSCLAIIKLEEHKDRVKASFLPTSNVLFDSTANNVDLSDCSYVILQYNIDKNVLSALYPQHAEEIHNATIFTNQRTSVTTVKPYSQTSCTVEEFWLRDYENLRDENDGKIYLVKILMGSGTILCREEVNYSAFPFAIATPMLNQNAYSIGNKFITPIASLVGQQLHINRILTLAMHSAQTTPGDIFLYTKAGIVDTATFAQGKINGVVECKPTMPLDQVAKKFEGSDYPAKCIQAAISTIEMAYTTMGLAPDSPDSTSPNQTAALMAQKDISSDVTMTSYINSFKQTQTALSKKLMSMIIQLAVKGQFEKEEKESRLVQEEDKRLEFLKKKIDFASLEKAAGTQCKIVWFDEGKPNTVSIERIAEMFYSVAVTFGDSIDSPTNHLMDFNKYMTMIQAGIPVDPKLVIKSSGVSDQDDALEYIDNMNKQNLMMQQQASSQAPPTQSPEEVQMMQQAQQIELQKKAMETRKIEAETEKIQQEAQMMQYAQQVELQKKAMETRKIVAETEKIQQETQANNMMSMNPMAGMI